MVFSGKRNRESSVIEFINKNTGWACGEDGYIIKT